VPRSALRAEPPENEFAFANNPLTEGARGRPGHVVPLNVLNIAAAVADEVVMLHAFRIESRGPALDGHFTH
jgi:ABC-type hemin transport system ATPase subunit